ncbi:vacuolar protein sorting 11 [Brevipalpus obovatus]|uniref:vacuolar protein sorting 11 n=1 Tax=Brevipalpus obovatus TaxID=246614 RepID=UPI003D9E8B7B
MDHLKDGVVEYYRQSKFYKLLLIYYTERDDYENVIKTCEEFGDEEPRLWAEAFCYFVKTADQAKVASYLEKALSEVDKRKLYPPVCVVDLIGKNCPNAPLSVFKDYLIRSLAKESEVVTENEKLIHQYLDVVEKTKKEIDSIQTQPKTFQSSRCSACNNVLKLPAIHFLCGHSYHYSCFGGYSVEDDRECPLCLPEHRKLLNAIDSHENQDVSAILNYK